MNTGQHPTRRPGIISVLCWIGFIGAPFTIFYMAASALNYPKLWHSMPFIVFVSIARFVCMLGLWKMRRAAVLAYAIILISIQVHLVNVGAFNPFGIVWPTVELVICFVYFRAMKWP